MWSSYRSVVSLNHVAGLAVNSLLSVSKRGLFDPFGPLPLTADRHCGCRCDFMLVDASEEFYSTFGGLRVFRMARPWHVKKGDCIGWKTDEFPVTPYDVWTKRSTHGRHNQVYHMTYIQPPKSTPI